jgi:hypothetical protein
VDLDPHRELLRLWQSVARYSFRNGMFVWAAPGDSLTDAQQLLCILYPATMLAALRLDQPDETSDEALEALRTIGNALDIPLRLMRSLNEYFDRHADADGQPLFTVDATRYRLDPEDAEWKDAPESVESFATGLMLPIAAIGFAKVLRSALVRPSHLREAEEMQQRAARRLTGALTGLLRSFVVRVTSIDQPTGQALLDIVRQPERPTYAVLNELATVLRLVTASLDELTVGAPYIDDARLPNAIYDLGFTWTVLFQAPEVETTDDPIRQPAGSAERVPHLPSTLLAMHAVEELTSVRTRVLAVLSDDQLRLASALRLRYDLLSTYWSQVARFGNHRWPLERVPWRTPDGHESDLYSLAVAEMTAVDLGARRGNDVAFSYLVRVFQDLVHRAGIVRPPRADDAPAMSSPRDGLEIPVAAAADAPFPAVAYRAANLLPALLLGLVRTAQATEHPQLRGTLEELVDLAWHHLTDAHDDLLAAFSHQNRPNWADLLLVAQALTHAVPLADGTAAQAAAPLGFAHELLAETEAMAALAQRTDLAGRLDRVRRIIDQQPGRAAALLYQIINELDEELGEA